MTNSPAQPIPITRPGRAPSPTLPPMNETEFSDKVAGLAQTCGFKVFHVRSAMTSKGPRTPVQYDGKGFPDLLLVHPQRKIVAFRELKVPPNKLSVEQRQWGLALNAAEADWEVWWPSDWPEIVRFLTNGKGVSQ